MAASFEVADRFREIADLLDLLGERFKPEAYRRAARSLDGLSEDLAQIVARGGLGEIPGIGEALAEKIREYLRDGRIAYRDRLVAEVPAGIVELLRVPGLGPKTVRRFWTELGVTGPDALRAALEAGRLTGVAGFGPKKIEQIRAGLTQGPAAARRPLWEATVIGEGLLERLRAAAPVDRIALAGSLRRARESVGDLDLLVTSRQPALVLDAFGRLDGIAEIRLRGDTKETVVLSDGLQVDLRVVAPESFGAAWQYFTGSKDHNVRLRTRAQKLGLRVNEYGVHRGEERIAGAEEEEVYRSLGLAWVPPELREDRGEIDRAESGGVPSLLEEADLRGDGHVHLGADAGPAQISAAVDSAAAAHHRSLGLVLPPATDAEALRRLRSAGERSELRLLWGSERPLGSAPSPIEEGLDFLLLTPTDPEPPGAGAAPPPPRAVLAHLSLDRTGLGEGDPARSERWIRWAVSAGVGLEIGPTAALDGLDSNAARAAAERGVGIWVTGHSTGRVDPRRLRVAVAFARRAGLAPGSVRNAIEDPGPAGATRPTPARPAPGPPAAGGPRARPRRR